MKVLRHVCRTCSNVQFFSVEVLSKAGTDGDAMRTAVCPFCETPLSIVFAATEIDMEEVADDPDVAAIRRALAMT
jgi:formate dehydrogenase maturation protein FdhE